MSALLSSINPAKQVQQFRRGDIPGADPLTQKLEDVDPLRDTRRGLVAIDKPQLATQATPTSTVTQPAGLNNANRTTSLASKQLLGG